MRPVLYMLRLVQMIPIILLMAAPFSDLRLQPEWRYGRSISVVYMFLGCASLLGLCVVSIAGHWSVVVWNSSLMVLLAVYYAGWTGIVHAPVPQKILVSGAMFQYAAMLNIIGDILTALLLDDIVRVANGDAGNGGAIFLLYLLASFFLWLLTWYLVWRILRKGLISQDKRAAKRGISYLCLMLSLFCLTAYTLDYKCQTGSQIFMLAMMITEMFAYVIFFCNSV